MPSPTNSSAGRGPSRRPADGERPLRLSPQCRSLADQRALFTRAAEGRHEARSAGTEPAERVHPEVVAVTDELGIDLRERVPRELLESDARWADVVVTMGCGDRCPYIPGRRYLDWDLPDPKGQPIEVVRKTREEIQQRVESLLDELS